MTADLRTACERLVRFPVDEKVQTIIDTRADQRCAEHERQYVDLTEARIRHRKCRRDRKQNRYDGQNER